LFEKRINRRAGGKDKYGCVFASLEKKFDEIENIPGFVPGPGKISNWRSGRGKFVKPNESDRWIQFVCFFVKWTQSKYEYFWRKDLSPQEIHKGTCEVLRDSALSFQVVQGF
jgi:hypothetical protein